MDIGGHRGKIILETHATGKQLGIVYKLPLLGMEADVTSNLTHGTYTRDDAIFGPKESFYFVSGLKPAPKVTHAKWGVELSWVNHATTDAYIAIIFGYDSPKVIPGFVAKFSIYVVGVDEERADPDHHNGISAWPDATLTIDPLDYYASRDTGDWSGRAHVDLSNWLLDFVTDEQLANGTVAGNREPLSVVNGKFTVKGLKKGTYVVLAPASEGGYS